MKSPVSQVNVIVVAERVIAIGGLPPEARTVSRRCQTAAGCGARIVMRWTAGSMGPEHTRTYVRSSHQGGSRAADRRVGLGHGAPGDREPRGGFLEHGLGEAVGDAHEAFEG